MCLSSKIKKKIIIIIICIVLYVYKTINRMIFEIQFSLNLSTKQITLMNINGLINLYIKLSLYVYIICICIYIKMFINN